MSLWRHAARGVRALLRRGIADRELDEEIAYWHEEAAAERVAAGASPDEARRAARLALGSAIAAREEVRDHGWERAAGDLVSDVRLAVRRLRLSPGFTVAAALTLALGIGASVAIFSAVHPILFEPLPYPHAARLTMLQDHGTDGAPADVTFGSYREILARSRSFDALAVMKPWQPTLTGRSQPERLEGQRVSAGYFRVLGAAPALGRDFLPSDDQVHGPRVAILGDALWRLRFGADSAIVGRTVSLDGTGFLVIGVLPAGFENVLAPAAELWAPLQYDAALPIAGREWGHHLRMVGRLRQGVSAAQAARELSGIARDRVPEFARAPWAAMGAGLGVVPLRDVVTHAVRPALLAVLGAVALLLLIAAVNVTNLLLARAARRRGEIAMRAALGAGRGRLVRQLLAESLVLASLGGAAGLGLARVGVRALVALAPAGLPRLDAIRLDGTVLAFALVLTTAVGLLVGIVPALDASRGNLHDDLRASARGNVGGHRATRAALVVAQVAFALVLLVSAGLLLRSLDRLFAVSPGFDPGALLTMQVQTAGPRYESDSVTQRFFAAALDAVRQVPGVRAAALTSMLPLSSDFDKYGVQLESNPVEHADQDESALRYGVSPGYLEAMGIPLRRGRAFTEQDRAGAPGVVIVSESFARHRFPGRDPIGQRVHVGRTDLPWYTIVGVAGDVKQASLAASQSDAVYVPESQWYFADRAMSLVVRTRRAGAAQVPAIRRAVWSVDPDQPIVRVATMSELLAATGADRRFGLVVFGAFALVAAALAATGIYGVLAGGVTERTREIGVRAALGASRSSILGLVVRQGMALAGLGAVLGLVGAAAASGALATMLFGVSRLDLVTYGGVLALLAVVSGGACLIPAWRAARVDPAITLRVE